MSRTRLRLLRERAAAAGLDGVLVLAPVHLRYLTGFRGSNGALLVTGDDAVLAVDGRYPEQAEAEAPDVRVVVDRRPGTALARRAADAGLRTVGVEEHLVPMETGAGLREVAQGVSLTATGRLVEGLRAVKDEAEVAALRAACAVADAALADVLAAGSLRAGVTEAAVARSLEVAMLAAGGEAVAFPTIVASGPNGSRPHHRPGERVLVRGDLVTIDFGAVVDGYHSDMTRTYAVGPPCDRLRELHALVAEAQAGGVAAARAGAGLAALDRAARGVVVAAGHGDAFPHGLGHGVGLEVHEQPILWSGAVGTLGERFVVTIEPGVYLPGLGGVRIEDVVVVGPAGSEVLTTADRGLVEV